MHFVTAKGILSSHNGMNLFRGCQHGCIYCDARSDCYQMNHVFEDIEVKENALQLLERALKTKRKPCMIGFGAMSDPYIPLEQELQMTRGALELIEKYGFGVAIQTKSSTILRDLDLLKSIHDRTKAVVQITLTTYDEDLCRLIEPPPQSALTLCGNFRKQVYPPWCGYVRFCRSLMTPRKTFVAFWRPVLTPG